MWFKSFIRDWLDNARFNFSGWVNGAVEADTCALISPTAQFSSSVLDIFTSAQQLLDQIKELDWPNQAESQLFYYRLIHQILEALFSYCNLNISQLVKDMRPLRTVLAASAIKTAKIGKFKIRIPKLKKKTPKSPKPLNASENVARLTSSMCVRYQNVLALKHHFANLCAQVPVPSETYVADSMFYGEPRYMVHLRIVSGQQLKVSRPWNLQMAIKVTAHAGRKDLGRTRLIQQSSSGVWGDDIYSVLCDKDISGGLGFNFMQYFDNQKEFTYAVGELGLEAIKSMIMISGPHEAVVNFGEYGKLQVELEFSTLLDFSVFYRMLDWQITATQAKMKELVVDQLCHDLRDRVHSISLNYKAPKLSNFLSKQAASNPGSNLADQEHVETNLALLFEFLNVNLEILTTHMDESFSLEIVKCIWDEFLKVSERMIVPSLGDDESEKRTPWDTKRINFFELYIQSACSFFRPDEDEGLSKEQINSPAFQQLESIVKHYALSKAELLEMYYQSTILNQFGNAGTGSGKFWILKLLKLRGYGEFVLTEMRDICTTSQLKTSTAMV